METFVSVMEMMMIVLFGISWPVNIVKAWKSRTAKGTSLVFYSFIWLGYVFALAGKFALIAGTPAPWYETVHWYIMFFYFLNIAMVTVGIAIYFRNRLIDIKNESSKNSDINENTDSKEDERTAIVLRTA